MLPVTLVAVGMILTVAERRFCSRSPGFGVSFTGWAIKFILITRAAYNQGFALPHTPIRGSGVPGPAVNPGWTLPSVGAGQFQFARTPRRPPQFNDLDREARRGSAQNAPQGHARRHRDPHRALPTPRRINFRLWAASIDGTGPFRPLPDSGGPFLLFS